MTGAGCSNIQRAGHLLCDYCSPANECRRTLRLSLQALSALVILVLMVRVHGYPSPPTTPGGIPQQPKHAPCARSCETMSSPCGRDFSMMAFLQSTQEFTAMAGRLNVQRGLAVHRCLGPSFMPTALWDVSCGNLIDRGQEPGTVSRI